MSKLMMILGFALLTQNAFAGALPYEWHICKAEGKTVEGKIVVVKGGGMNDVEASDSAMYFCQANTEITGCEITGCSYEVLRPRAHSNVSGE